MGRRWLPDARGQTAFYLAALFLPLLILLGTVINTGEMLDRKIESQNAADAAAIATGAWAARVLNFISASNVAMTKMYAAVSVIDGAEAASKAIWARLLLESSRCFAMAAAEAARCIESKGLCVICCRRAVEYARCGRDLARMARKWMGWNREWNQRASRTINPRLKSAMRALMRAQSFSLRPLSAMMAVSADRAYRRNLGEAPGRSTGMATILGGRIDDYFPYIRKNNAGRPSTTFSYLWGGTEGAGCLVPGLRPFNRGPANHAASRHGDSRSRAPIDGVDLHWAGLSEFGGFASGTGPFEVYRRPLTGPASLALPENLHFFHRYCFRCGVPDPGFPSLSQRFERSTFLTFTSMWLCKNQALPFRIYILRGSGSEDNKRRVWNEDLDRDNTHRYNGRQMVGFDHIVMGVRDAPHGVAHAFDPGFKLHQERDLGPLRSPRGLVSLSAVEVYNSTQADLFTQDWRCRLVPIEQRTLSRVDRLGVFTRGPLAPAFRELLVH